LAAGNFVYADACLIFSYFALQMIAYSLPWRKYPHDSITLSPSARKKSEGIVADMIL
jgi:hypothetical protein